MSKKKMNTLKDLLNLENAVNTEPKGVKAPNLEVKKPNKHPKPKRREEDVVYVSGDVAFLAKAEYPPKGTNEINFDEIKLTKPVEEVRKGQPANKKPIEKFAIKKKLFANDNLKNIIPKELGNSDKNDLGRW